MRSIQLSLALALAARAAAHGYIYRVTADNAVYGPTLSGDAVLLWA